MNTAAYAEELEKIALKKRRIEQLLAQSKGSPGRSKLEDMLAKKRLGRTWGPQGGQMHELLTSTDVDVKTQAGELARTLRKRTHNVGIIPSPRVQAIRDRSIRRWNEKKFDTATSAPDDFLVKYPQEVRQSVARTGPSIKLDQNPNLRRKADLLGKRIGFEKRAFLGIPVKGLLSQGFRNAAKTVGHGLDWKRVRGVGAQFQPGANATWANKLQAGAANQLMDASRNPYVAAGMIGGGAGALGLAGYGAANMVAGRRY